MHTRLEDDETFKVNGQRLKPYYIEEASLKSATFIGIFVFIVEWAVTKELNIAIALSGIFSGGVYDLGKAFMQLVNKEEK